MISTWIGYPLHSESSPKPSAHLQANTPSVPSHQKPTGGTRPRCSRRRTGPVNRRESARMAHWAEVTLDLLGLNHSRQRSLKAQVVNASEGGLCVVLNRSLVLSAVIRCRFQLKDLPVTVPTLLQVRWVEPTPEGKYRCGLMYLV